MPRKGFRPTLVLFTAFLVVGEGLPNLYPTNHDGGDFHYQVNRSVECFPHFFLPPFLTSDNIIACILLFVNTQPVIILIFSYKYLTARLYF